MKSSDPKEILCEAAISKTYKTMFNFGFTRDREIGPTEGIVKCQCHATHAYMITDPETKIVYRCPYHQLDWKRMSLEEAICYEVLNA